MADGIQITTAEVRGLANSINNTNEALAQTLEQIKSKMDGLASTWQSEASDTIRTKFNSLAPRFQEYRDVVQSYSKFLNTTADNYDATESAINSSASSFK